MWIKRNDTIFFNSEHQGMCKGFLKKYLIMVGPCGIDV
jgi:hypothetical protein